MTRHPSSSLTLLAVTAFSALASPVFAATNDAASASTSAATSAAAASAASEGAQSVVVTGVSGQGYGVKVSDAATGLDLSRRETPQSISVISQKELQDFALTELNAAMRLATGVTVESVETDRTYYSARGFDIVNFQVDGIGLPVDGNLNGALDTALDERIDIVRGAAGLLASTGNPSATINLVRKRPTHGFQASAALTLGSWNDRRVEADIGSPLNASGTLRGRVIAVAEGTDSYLDRFHRDSQAFAALVDLDLTPDTTLELGYTQQGSNSNSPSWGALPLTWSDGSAASYRWGASTASDWSWWDNTQRRTHLELKHDFGNGWHGTGVLTRVTAASNSELFYVYGTEDPVTHTGALAYPSAYGGEYDQTLVNLRLSGPFQAFGRTHSLTVGADTGRQTTVETSSYPAAGIGDALPDLDTWGGVFPHRAYDPAFDDGSDFKSRRTSVYAAAHLSVADGVAVIVGANATKASSSGANYGVEHAYSRHALTPYVGTVVDLSDSTSAYASFTRIFNPQTQIDKDHLPLMPIQGRNIEAGLKSEWFAKKLQTSLAVFQTHQDNTATQDAGFNEDGITTYHGENATSTGFEAEVSGRLADGWNLNAGYTQLRIKDDAGQLARLFVPRRLLKLATTVALPTLPALQVGATLAWQSQTSTTDDSAGLGDIVVRQKAYAVLGLMAHYDLSKHWSAGLNVDNVTNNRHWASLAWNQALYAPPRSVSANLRWTY
ncbi:MAG: TonB-dependent siderophore receptor [Betaproteobacteria bacterium]